MATAFIALGGNVGEVHRTFRAAREALATLPGCRLAGSSLLYRSTPIGPPDQPDYLNAAIALDSELMPRTLLHEMQRIEGTHGRVRDARWGPRTLDLDLIAMGDMLSDTPELILPHAEMHNRVFVLQPLCDLAPEWQHPRMGKTTRELLDACLHTGQALLDHGSPW